MSYPNYSRSERIADGVIHVLGISAAIYGVILLFQLFEDQLQGARFLAVSVYAAALLTMLTASATYHIAAHTKARPILRRLDHAAIYLKIAGTITPLAVFLGTAFGYLVLASVWGLALVGAATKLMAKRGRMTTGWVPYAGLGWIGLALFVPLIGVLPVFSLVMIAAGGLLYTAGVIFYCWEGLRYANAIWHGFIVVASTCLYISISNALSSAAYAMP